MKIIEVIVILGGGVERDGRLGITTKERVDKLLKNKNIFNKKYNIEFFPAPSVKFNEKQEKEKHSLMLAKNFLGK